MLQATLRPLRCKTAVQFTWVVLVASLLLLISWQLWRGPAVDRMHPVREPAVATAASIHAVRAAQTAHAETRALEPVSESQKPRLDRPAVMDSHVHQAQWVDVTGTLGAVQLCQLCQPVIRGVDSAMCGPEGGEPRWQQWQPIPWQVFAQGEYVGPHRPAHIAEYRLRVDDQLEFVYRLTREESVTPYQLNVGDTIQVESITDATISRELLIQPDGSITLPLLGQVRAAGRTVDQLRRDLDELYAKYYKVPAITVTPLKQNTRLEDLRAAVDSRAGQGGQNRSARVTPEGTIQLPGIGNVYVQGFTLDEVKREVDERYAQVVSGIEVQPVLVERAPRYVFVLGEVGTPGRYPLEGPTTAMQALALAGGWRNGGNLREVIVFRRAEDWRLIATKLDLRGGLYGKRPAPADEIWLRDADVVVVPPSSLKAGNDVIELIFTRGIYGVVPFQGVAVNFARASTL